MAIFPLQTIESSLLPHFRVVPGRIPAVLERLWPSSMPVRLQEGQQLSAPLRVIPAPTDLVQ